MSHNVTLASRVLVVDDEPGICQVLADALRQAGLEVSTAGSTRAALIQADQFHPDLVVTDLSLPDGNGIEVIDRLRQRLGDLPVVIITGVGESQILAEATRCRPVELLTKPVDVARLQQVVWAELSRQDDRQRQQRRHVRLRDAVRRISRRRRQSFRTVGRTCSDLTTSCRYLQTELERHKALAAYQTDLLNYHCEDDVFRRMFRLFAERSGAVFGVAMLCDENAELQLVGRFGVPTPDGINFSRQLAMALVPGLLEQPQVKLLDATDHLSIFPDALQRFMVGVNVLAVPLMIDDGQMIGLAVLYRKGEQPFSDDDVALARAAATPTALAVTRGTPPPIGA